MIRKIESYDELLVYAKECLYDKESLSPLDIGTSLDFEIKLTGKTWDGSIDYRLAGYILELQKTIDKLFKDLEIELAEEDRPIVKFRVEKGCTKLWVQISKTVETLLKNMTSGQKTFVATVAILSVVGVFTGTGFKEFKLEQMEYAHELKQQEMVDTRELRQQEMLVDVIEKLADKIPNYEKPTKKLVAKMKEGDAIESSIDSIKRTKKEIKSLYPTKSKFKAENVYIDNKYLITAIKLTPGTITIEQGTHKYDCLSALTGAEADDLFSRVKDAHAKGKGFELDLKITAKYFKGSKQLKDLIIFDIGEPRDGACTIDSLIGPST